VISDTPRATWPTGEPGLTRQYATVCGFQMSYVTGGQGAPIILIHGLGSDGANWRKVLPLLAEHYTVYAVDLLGCGESDKPPIAYTIEAFAHYLRFFMDAVGIERAHLFGHSLGGGVALQTLYFSPDRVDRVVLVDSGGLGRDVHWLLRISTLPGADQVINLMSNPRSGITTLARRLEQRAKGQSDEAYQAEIAGMLEKLRVSDARRSFLRMVRAIGSLSGQTVSALPHLAAQEKTPFLLIWGEKDAIIPLSHGRSAHALLSRSHLEIIPNSFHQPHIEQPSEVAHLMLDFLTAETWPPEEKMVHVPDATQTTRRPNKNWRRIAPVAVAAASIPTGLTMLYNRRKRILASAARSHASIPTYDMP